MCQKILYIKKSFKKLKSKQKNYKINFFLENKIKTKLFIFVFYVKLRNQTF